jgi:hypothetical protein
MDALRRSVEAERGGSAKRQAPSVRARGSESERPKPLKRLLESLGLQRRPRTVNPPTLDQYLRHRSKKSDAGEQEDEVA